jgi:hypothetical protein
MDMVTRGFDLAMWLQAAGAIEAELHQLVRPLSEAQFHAPPRNGGWSVGFCIEHLVLTGRAFLPKWDLAIAEAARKEARVWQAVRYPWWQRRILLYAENPAKLKQKTAPAFEPCARRTIEQTVARFVDMHQDVMRRAAASKGLDVSRTKVQSPVVSLFRCSLGFSFDLFLAHERRHLRQAGQVRRNVTDGLKHEREVTLA